jgi:hypothetical protein
MIIILNQLLDCVSLQGIIVDPYRNGPQFTTFHKSMTCFKASDIAAFLTENPIWGHCLLSDLLWLPEERVAADASEIKKPHFKFCPKFLMRNQGYIFTNF